MQATSAACVGHKHWTRQRQVTMDTNAISNPITSIRKTLAMPMAIVAESVRTSGTSFGGAALHKS
jgi:hypothetical protein